MNGKTCPRVARAFVRFADTERAAEHTNAIEAAGFVVDEVLSYAPQAAWVRSESGEISDAVDRLDDLAAIEGVEHVEAQFLREMTRKDQLRGSPPSTSPTDREG